MCQDELEVVCREPCTIKCRHPIPNVDALFSKMFLMSKQYLNYLINFIMVLESKYLKSNYKIARFRIEFKMLCVLLYVFDYSFLNCEQYYDKNTLIQFEFQRHETQ